MREATHRGDALLSEISIGRSRVDITLLANAEDSLVDLSSVVITLLTCSGHSVTHTSRMPSTDTSHLTKASVGLSWQTGDTPTGDDTSKTVTAGSGADVDNLALSEKFGDLDLVLEKPLGELNL